MAEPAFLNRAFAGGWRHSTHRLNRISYRLLAIGRQAVELGIHRAELLLLCSRQVFPGLHVLQYSLLPLRRQTVKVLEPLL